MEVYGNKTWNDATDNRDKTLVSMAEETFHHIEKQLENAGINYFAYSKDNKAVMAVNDKDLDWLKQIIGTDAEKIKFRKSEIPYTPPHKNIIGNAEYRYIPQKEYLSLDSDTALKIAELLEKQNISFSGRVSAYGKTTLTVSHDDLEQAKQIQNRVIAMRKQFAKPEKADEIIGNLPYRSIRNRHYFHSRMKPEEYKEIQPFLEDSISYSGLIRDGKVIFTVEKDAAAVFYMALETAHRESEIHKELAEIGLRTERITELKDVIHQFAAEDISIGLDSFFEERYSDTQFAEMMQLTQNYLAQSPTERIGKDSALNAMLQWKHDFDISAEMESYFSMHSYSDEQKALLSALFQREESSVLMEAIDESFSPEEIQQYSQLLQNYSNVSEITEFLKKHNEPPKTDSIQFRFGNDTSWFTESSILADFAEQHSDISFALANAVLEYLDEKQHTERSNPELHAGWYKKTNFTIFGVLNGKEFNYEGRFDIGDGKGTGGGSLIDHIRDFNQGILNSTSYPYHDAEHKKAARETLDVFLPFLESNAQLTAEEQQILSDFKAKNPIRTEPTQEQSTVIADFRAKTEELFHEINGYHPEDIENTVRSFIAESLAENFIEAEIGEIIVSGSRCRGLEKAESDIDVVVEIKGSALKEVALFNLFHEEVPDIDGILIDINPIRPEETGTLEAYLPSVEAYLSEKAAEIENVRNTEPERTADEIEIGDKYRLKGMFGEKEVTVTSMHGVYPDDVGITEHHKSGAMEYETTSNIDRFKLHREGEYLGKENEVLREEADTVKMTLYHGTMADFDRFRPDYRGAIWTDTDFARAERFAGNLPESKVLTCEAELQNPAHFTFGSAENWDIDETIRKARQSGHDAAVIDFQFMAEENSYYQYVLENALDTPASKILDSILGVSGADALYGESVAAFAQRMAGNNNILHSYVAVLNPDLIRITDRTSVYEPEERNAEEKETDSPDNIDTSEIREDTPLFIDEAVFEEIAKAERADEEKPFRNTYGEQLSLFCDTQKKEQSVSVKKTTVKDKSPSPLFVGDVNTIAALHDEILRGSGFHDGKLRIQAFYQENNPDTKSFANFLKNEYGTGGHSADDPIALVGYDSKGIQFTLSDENGRFSENTFHFTWTEVAKNTAELIEKGVYLNHAEREAYSKAKSPEKAKEQSDALQNNAVSEQNTAEKAESFTITDDSIGEGGAKTKFRNNIAAIEALKMLEQEERPATEEEKETLSRYVGWGGIPQAFDQDNVSWSKEYTQLKELLSPQEYRQANASVLDAFYTSPTVIDGIYEALEKFGFTGGNVLEPAMGVGNFFGRMPEDMRSDSKLYGIELDGISGRIAQKLYPDADIAIQGFEKNHFQNGCFDVAVGNVPFGELHFKDNKHGTTKLHDYFFAETLDKVKNGCIVAFVTSAGTLDKRDESTRKMLAERADLIGAIRLPGGKNGAFKENAGTEVTTDIIFLQKNENKTPDLEKEAWISIDETADGLPVNSYFAENPDMVLGTIVEGNKLYGSGTMVIAEDGFDWKSALQDAVGRLSAEISSEKTKEVYARSVDGIAVRIPSDLRNYSFFEQNDQIFFKRKENVCHRVYEKDSSQFERAKAFIALRDITRELLEAQELDKPDSVIQELQAKLNTVYDNFYEKYGLLHSQSNKRYFSDDISYNLVAGLEKKFDKNKLEEKSDIFTKRTIQPPKSVEHVETALEALTLSVAETAGVDFDYMSKLTGMTEAELKKDLIGEIYKIPHTENTYQTASEYLSGDIRQKLMVAEEAVSYDSDFNINVNALKNAMPEPLKAGDIDVKIGATWLDPKYYEQFLYETLQTPRSNRSDLNHFAWQRARLITTEYSEHTGSWHINNKNQDNSVISRQQYGSRHMNAYEIMEHLLNLKEPKVYKTIEVPDGMGDTKEKRVVDIDATRVVQKKAEKLKESFKKWIFQDPERREAIVEKYNALFNSVRPREYDGSQLSFPMMNADIQLHDHQKNAIAHAMFGGNTLFAHSVGAGKTFEMIATAMESKRLGLCTKSMFAVPNHLTEQIGDDFQKLYPSANILVATKKDFQKENRQQLFAKIATGNFDAVIIGHSQLGMIPISKERQENMIQSQIDDIVSGIEELKRSEGSKFQIKAMERTKKSLEKNLDKLQKNHDDTITFEQLGVDKLFVDEAHEFKNLFTPTKLNNISGISTSASQKALDLFMKCRYLDEKTGGKGVVFATGTPLSNSVTELHTMMRYLEYDFLKDHGLANFDNWVTVFGEQKTDWELAPAGNKFKERTRIANYSGMPELMSMFKQIADIRTADTLQLDVPDCDYKVINVEATPFQKELVDELADRADAINAGNVDPSVDNMLKITSDGRKLGLDPRLIDPSFEDNPETKLNQCVENVARIHAETAQDRLTQIIFCDLGVPHKTGNTTEAEKSEDSKSSSERDSLEEECDFCVYDDIKKKLIAKGIPESEIAYIHNAKTEKQKTELFDKVRNGEVRVLLGSTAKMGTGTNVQKKLIAVHDLDIPWRPSDLEQRAGRIIRQGNENKNVSIYRYVTKGTFDAYSYQTLEKKQRFISQIMTSKEPARKCEDVDQQALSYSEIKALCTGDERIKEKLMLDNEVKELRVLASEHQNTVYEMQDKIKAFPEREKRLTAALENLRSDREHLRTLPIDAETKLPVFRITIGETEYTDRKEAAKAFERAALATSRADTPVKVGEFQGFSLSITVHSPAMGGGMSAVMQGEHSHTTNLIESFAHNLRRLEGCLYNIDRRIDDVNNSLAKLRVDYTEAQKIVAEPFPQADELAEKEERLKVLTDELNQAAIEAKKNAPKKEKTCYFERAKLKREAVRIARRIPEKANKTKSQKKDRE